MSTLLVRSAHHLALGAGIIVALSSAGCCMGGGATAPSASGVAIPGIAPIPGLPAIAPAAMQNISIGPGFAPDPTTVATTAGGPIPASSLATPGVFCAGNIGATPNITLTTTAPITGLRVLVRSTEDTTLMVRLADGTVICDDDGGGYPNPAMQADFPAGTHLIYVGSFHAGETPAATVGLTVNPAVQNAALP